MKKLRVLVAVVLAAGLIAGVVGIVRQKLDYSSGHQAYDYAKDIGQIAVSDAASATETAEPSVRQPSVESQRDSVRAPDSADIADIAEPAAQTVDLPALQAVNSDVIGWLSIPGTDVSYPLLQTADNDYYLTHTWDGESNSVGAIFMDCRSRSDLSDFNTLIYGHNMKDGSMFSPLRSYADEDFYTQAPTILLTDETGTHHYAIFAAYTAKTDAALYTPGADDPEYARQVLDFAAENSVIETGILPGGDDHILTLITCVETGSSTRWIVQAVLTDEDRQAKQDTK